MVYNCVFWLNSFPHKDGVHSTISPRAIMTGQRIKYDKHCRLEFGTYVQTHKKHDNSLEPRTSGAIALRPSGNEQGGHYFLSLHTGKRILRNNWTVLPMPNNVLDAVHRLAAASKQAGGIIFTDTFDKALLSITRTTPTDDNNIPRHQKYNPTSREWKILKFKENLTHQCMVLLCSRQDKKGEVKVAFCPTMNMLADFFTKPLQGSTFKKMRSIILNMPDTDNTSIEHRSVLENRKIMEERKEKSRCSFSKDMNSKNARKEPK